MQKRNNLLFLIVFILSIPCLIAQNTGYMGKRVIVNMGAEFSPAWIRPVSDNLKFQCKWYSFNCILSPSIEVIAHKKGTAGVVYHYLNTRYNTPSEAGFVFGEDVKELKTNGFGIFYKQYIGSERGRAPIGPYLKAQFDGFFFKVPTSHEESIMKSNQLFAMKLEIGNSFLLFNRLCLSTGFSLGLPFGGFKGLGYDNDWGLFGLFDGDDSIEECAKSRIFGAYWIGFTVNIGFLAF